MTEITPTSIPTGQAAGDTRYELLRDPLSDFVRDAEAFAEEQWMQNQGVRLFEALPGFTSGLLAARTMARLGEYRRKDMPVVDETDLEALKADLALSGIAAEPNCVIRPREAHPSQCQIYVDKAVTGTARFGVDGTLDFLRSNHLVVTEDDFVVDGHHRWLTAWTIDPDVMLPAFRIPASLCMVRPEILRFSDSRHPRNL